MATAFVPVPMTFYVHHRTPCQGLTWQQLMNSPSPWPSQEAPNYGHSGCARAHDLLRAPSDSLPRTDLAAVEEFTIALAVAVGPEFIVTFLVAMTPLPDTHLEGRPVELRALHRGDGCLCRCLRGKAGYTSAHAPAVEALTPHGAGGFHKLVQLLVRRTRGQATDPDLVLHSETPVALPVALAAELSTTLAPRVLPWGGLSPGSLLFSLEPRLPN